MIGKSLRQLRNEQVGPFVAEKVRAYQVTGKTKELPLGTRLIVGGKWPDGSLMCALWEGVTLISFPAEYLHEKAWELVESPKDV
jgi:hypothetical protein